MKTMEVTVKVHYVIINNLNTSKLGDFLIKNKQKNPKKMAVFCCGIE